MSSFYYLVLWKSYLEKKNTQKPSAVVMHLRKLISTFYKKYLEKLTVTSLTLDFTPLMARITVLKEQPKQNYGRPSKEINKRSKNQGVVLKPLMNNSCIFRDLKCRCYTQAFNPKISSLSLMNIRFSLSFFQLGFGGFSSSIKQQMIRFLLCFLIKFRKFFIDRVLQFYSSFFY